MPQKGIFIVFEGIDGAGKSTQIKLLAEALAGVGRAPVLSREPTDGPWGRKLRESAATGRLSLDEELDAFIRDRTDHVNHLIFPSLAEGRIVILDRYFYSTVAYQGSRGMDVAALKQQMESLFPIPDLVFLLDLDPREAVRRIAHSRGGQPDEFEKLEALVRVRGIFNSLRDPHILRLDAALPAEQTHAEIWRAVEPMLG